MKRYFDNFESLKPFEKQLVLGELDDLSEDEYIYANPSIELSDYVVHNLIKYSLLETEKGIQYEILCTLYHWSWYPGNDDYNDLINAFEKLLSPAAKEIVVRILIASGSNKYLDFFTVQLNSDNEYIREIAKEGIDLINLKQKE